MKKLLVFLLPLAAVMALAATFPSGGVTHHNLIAVLEQVSPTTDTNDRALIEFTGSDGVLYVLIMKASTGGVAVVKASNGATITTTTTTTTTSTTTTTTSTTTTTT